MLNNPKVSVIIPTYNRIQLLNETLKTVFEQSHGNIECIVVDDGSEDNTISVLNEISAVEDRLVFKERNREPKGASTCRNIGIVNATGKYLMFVDSDDLMDKYCIENRLRLCQDNPGNDFYVFPAAYLQRSTKEIQQKMFYYYDDKINPIAAFLKRPQWHTSSSFWNTRLLQNSNHRFDENVPRWQDWEFHIRALIKEMTYKRFKGSPDVFIRLHHDDVRISKVMKEKDFPNYKLNILMENIQDELEQAEFWDDQSIQDFFTVRWVKLLMRFAKFGDYETARTTINILNEKELLHPFKLNCSMVLINLKFLGRHITYRLLKYMYLNWIKGIFTKYGFTYHQGV